MSTTSPWVVWTGWWRTSPIVQTATCASLTRAPSGSPSHPSGPRLCHTALLGACWRNWGPRRSMSPIWTTGDSMSSTRPHLRWAPCRTLYYIFVCQLHKAPKKKKKSLFTCYQTRFVVTLMCLEMMFAWLLLYLEQGFNNIICFTLYLNC